MISILKRERGKKIHNQNVDKSWLKSMSRLVHAELFHTFINA